MTRPLTLLLACLVLLAVAGCGGDDESESQAGATATPTPEDTGGEQGTAAAPGTPQEVNRQGGTGKGTEGAVDGERNRFAVGVPGLPVDQVERAHRRGPRHAGQDRPADPVPVRDVGEVTARGEDDQQHERRQDLGDGEDLDGMDAEGAGTEDDMPDESTTPPPVTETGQQLAA